LTNPVVPSQKFSKTTEV